MIYFFEVLSHLREVFSCCRIRVLFNNVYVYKNISTKVNNRKNYLSIAILYFGNMSSDEKIKNILKILWYQELYLFLIALVIICIFGIMILVHFPDDEQIGQGLFMGFIAWIGAIVGFYFGQKPVREILTRMEETNKQVEEKKHIADKVLEEGYEASDFIEKLINEIKLLKNKIKEK